MLARACEQYSLNIHYVEHHQVDHVKENANQIFM